MGFLVGLSLGVLFLLLCFLLLGTGVQVLTARSFPPRGGFVDVDGHKIHVIERPGGEVPLVLLHGASSSSVDYQLSLFESLPKRFKVLAIDRPGLAHSERKFHRGESLQGQVELIHKTVQEVIGKPAYVMVHSLSGVLGARLLTDYPESYLGMLGIAPALYPIGDGKSWYTIVAELPVLGWIFRQAFVPWAGHIIAPGLIAKNFFPNKVPSNYKQDSCLALMFGAQRFLHNARDLNLIRSFLDESYPLYREIKQPVSLIFGKQDQILATFSHAYGFQHHVPHTKIHILDETGHLPHHFHQELVVDELLSLLPVEH